MKRVTILALALVYLAMAGGVVVNVHYCMGRIASVTLGYAQSDRCEDCGMENAGCCKDEVVVVKVDDSHALAPATVLPALPPATLSSQPPGPRLPLALRLSPLVLPEGYPPGAPDGRSICILNSVFRI